MTDDRKDARSGPWHAGEQALQRLTGAAERMALQGPKVIRDQMPDQHRELFEKLPTMFVGTLDGDGQPWATVVHGAPGFVRAPDARTLRLAAFPDAGDPARAGLRVGARVGLLGLEPHTRRRNRANGVIVAMERGAWSVRVEQSYGNCPKYIHGREPMVHAERALEQPMPERPRLGDLARDLVERCDTMFIASSSAATVSAGPDLVAGAGVDVSHRGGPVGFVTLERGEVDVLTIPDYAGNSMFNTLGNLLVWPRAGLLFLDWREGHLLHLAVTASVETEGPGAPRRLRMTVRGGWLRPFALPLSWTPPAAPPQLANRT